MAAGVRDDVPERAIRRVRHRLLRQAQLFDDPEAYAAGVLDTLDALLDEDRLGAGEGARRVARDHLPTLWRWQP